MGAQCSDCVARSRDGDRRNWAVAGHTTDGHRTLLENHSGQHPSVDYELNGALLGEGGFGSVKRVRSKRTGVLCALKTVDKAKANRKNVMSEVDINLSIDHPNVVRMFDVYEDEKNVYMVFEVCRGGEVLDKIIERQQFSERDALHLAGQLLYALNYLHANCIAHRDIKLENLLLKDDAEQISEASVKVIDFGMSKRFIKHKACFETVVGSAFYVAPEVLQSNNGEFDSGYTEKCDVWSAGVVLFMLLSGEPPFPGEDQPAILDKVRTGHLQFPPHDWLRISREATDLVKHMLKRNVQHRVNAEAALSMWKAVSVPPSPRPPSPPQRPQPAPQGPAGGADAPAAASCGAHPETFFRRLKAFGRRSRFEKTARHLIARHIEESNIEDLRQSFKLLDKDGDGMLCLKEVKEGLQSAGFKDASCLDEVFGDIDTDNSHKIDYTEFIAATMGKLAMVKEDLCWEAFRVFDKDGDGRISAQELKETLSGQGKNHGKEILPRMTSAEAQELLQEADVDQDGFVTFPEFMQMMGRSNSVDVQPRELDKELAKVE